MASALPCDEILAPPPEWNRRLTGRASELLEAGKLDLVAVLGRSSTLHAMALFSRAGLHCQVLAVEPPQAAAPFVPSTPEVRTIQMDSLEFSEFPVTWDRILCNGVLGLAEDAERLAANLSERVCDGGRLLVAESAPSDGTPLFGEALRCWRERRRSAEHLTALLDRVGFDVRSDSLEIECSCTPADCYTWLTHGAWPVLAHFGADEVERGIEELRRAHEAEQAIVFALRLDLILGIRRRRRQVRPSRSAARSVRGLR